MNQSNGVSELFFDGAQTYIEIPSSADFSLPTAGALTVSAWIKPQTLTFPNTEGSGYVHWMGKGEPGQEEWVLRMYSQDNTEHRGNRISFYVFNLQGGLGVGSHFQDPLQPGVWIHVVGAADQQNTYIYRDGVLRDSDTYTGKIVPQAGSAPVRIGTRDLHSFFLGGIRQVRIWNRVLTALEVENLYTSDQAPQAGLVAEYLLIQDIALDTAGGHSGTIFQGAWITP